MSDCEHQKVVITVDDNGTTREVCPICDDVQVQTLDDHETGVKDT